MNLITWVISKETVGNSWDTVNAIFGHDYHHDHPNTDEASK